MAQKCRICDSALIPVMDFGNIYFSDFVDNPLDGFKSPLKIGMCEKCGLVQLFDAPDPEKMYRKYWYRSGINESMIRSLRDIQRKLYHYITLEKNDTILDIGANDGTFLGLYNHIQYLSDDKIKRVNAYTRIGIDPAQNLKEFYRDKCEYYIEDFFSAKNYWSVAKEKAKVITSIAMFYDLPDPVGFVEQVKDCLHPEGVWVIQLSYLPLMLEQNAFDNVCHEHIEYFTLNIINDLLNKHDLKIIDLELNDVNSGSIRIYVAHKAFAPPISTHAKILGEFRVKSLLDYERRIGVCDSTIPYFQFMKRIKIEKEKTLNFLKNLKKENKLVIGYGASTKGNTLLQYYGIGPELIPYIAERTKEKWDKVTVGSGIRIISEEEMRAKKPDYLFVFPWHFVSQFQQREKILRDNGAKFIVPLPEFQIV